MEAALAGWQIQAIKSAMKGRKKVTPGRVLAQSMFVVINNDQHFCGWEMDGGLWMPRWGRPESGRKFHLLAEARAVCDRVGGCVYDAAGLLIISYTD